MADEHEIQSETARRVLESAVDVFAEKGFRDATVHEICERADANIAAVNYYFGSKARLYAEAWRHAFRNSLQAHPPDGGVPEDAPPEERLRGRVRAMIHLVADEDNQAFRMAHREMANPTQLLDEVRRECVRPLQKGMRAVLRELLGPDVPQKHVHFCQAGVAAQCFGVIRHIRLQDGSPGGHPPPLEEIIRDPDAYAEHVFRFSLAGVRAVRESLESPGAHETAEGPA